MSHSESKRVGRYDLVTPLRPCKDEIVAKFEQILMSGAFILGEEVRLLEEEVAEACGVPHAVGVASGSSALVVALMMAGVQSGDEVITTPYTFDATMEAILLLDAVPVFVDIKPDDLNINPEKIEAAITEKTRAIMPVPIFGAPCDMNAINGIAKEHGLEVVMDMAQAFGTLFEGQPMGSFSRMSTLSFYPTKNLPGIGDGGMVVCKNEEDAENIKRIRAHQTVTVKEHLYPGWNSRLDAIQAMAIRVRLARFDEEQADRDRVAAIYDAHIPVASRLATPDPAKGMHGTYHQYWVRCQNRSALQAELDRNGIDTGIYYDPPLHKHELSVYGRSQGDLPEAERAGREILTLPIHAAVPFEDATRIGKIVGDFLAAATDAAGS
jgi:dTDP-4-amino-4,6-dideoxygalactose transaminase